jgi:uroporphyrinogen decarboxylase
MNSRDRVLLAVNHQELDRVPFDLGGTGLTTIHVPAYEKLHRHLMLPEQAPRIGFMLVDLKAF